MSEITASVTLPWDDVHAIVTWLDTRNGRSSGETALRLLKVTEEAGEAAQAYIGTRGQNPRKGVSHSNTDVATELCDVIVAAMVALHSFHPDPAALLATVTHKRGERLRAVLEVDFA